MKPKDANGKLPPEDRPFRVLLLAGSDRRQYDCPGIDSKARALMFRMGDRLPQDWIVTGPIFRFGDTWQLVINTATTIVTFLMVFLIQNTQNRDSGPCR